MKVLVVSPHPDDETLGAGGTILKLLREGNEVYWLNVTAMLDLVKFSSESIKKRKEQISRIEEFYKFTKTYHLNFPSTELENIDSSKAIDMIGEIFREIEPNVLILPDYNDAHSDHKKVFDWCYACSKVFRYPYVKKILTMEIISETDFGRPESPFYPNYYVDITDFFEKKIQAMQIYDTEMKKPPFPRNKENMRALALLRGSTAGVMYAEAFRLIKCIEK